MEFSSGTDIGLSMIACMLREDDKVVDYVYCLVPRTDYEIIDDWHTLGMRSTSSKTVRCKDVFVPPHRVLSMYVAKPGHSWPGLEVHRNPHYRIPTSALGGHCIGACMVGNARAALDTTIELVKSRSTSYTGAKMRDFQTVQLRVSKAAAQVDAAALLMRNDCLEAAKDLEDGGTLAVETVCVTSATVLSPRGFASKPSIRCTRWQGRTGSTTNTRSSACSRLLALRLVTSASAPMRSFRRGGRRIGRTVRESDVVGARGRTLRETSRPPAFVTVGAPRRTADRTLAAARSLRKPELGQNAFVSTYPDRDACAPRHREDTYSPNGFSATFFFQSSVCTSLRKTLSQ